MPNFNQKTNTGWSANQLKIHPIRFKGMSFSILVLVVGFDASLYSYLFSYTNVTGSSHEESSHEENEKTTNSNFRWQKLLLSL